MSIVPLMLDKMEQWNRWPWRINRPAGHRLALRLEKQK
jgi:hypothetical protein